MGCVGPRGRRRMIITELLKQVSLPYLSLNKEKVWVR
jgi:hypothetical protein